MKDISCVELYDGTIAYGGRGDGYSIKLWKEKLLKLKTSVYVESSGNFWNT